MPDLAFDRWNPDENMNTREPRRLTDTEVHGILLNTLNMAIVAWESDAREWESDAREADNNGLPFAVGRQFRDAAAAARKLADEIEQAEAVTLS